MNEFKEYINFLKQKYPDLKEGLLNCYLCNFEDEHVCNEYNGGCKCKTICESLKNNSYESE